MSQPPAIPPLPSPSSLPPPPLPPPPLIADDTANNLVNMYFLMLAALVVLLLVGLWYWQQNKRRKRLRSAGRRRSALEQDLELSFGRPTWLGLNRREREDEEGLNERGEPPPPYMPPPPPLEPALPERARVRDGEGLPKYEEFELPRAEGSGTLRGDGR